MKWRLLGLTSATGVPYLFWSGFGTVFIPVLLQIAAFTAIYYWHHKCNVHRCVRLARHTEPGTNIAVCRKHSGHPEHITHEYLLKLRERNAHLHVQVPGVRDHGRSSAQHG